jgi:hypothetical protein
MTLDVGRSFDDDSFVGAAMQRDFYHDLPKNCECDSEQVSALLTILTLHVLARLVQEPGPMIKSASIAVGHTQNGNCHRTDFHELQRHTLRFLGFEHCHSCHYPDVALQVDMAVVPMDRRTSSRSLAHPKILNQRLNPKAILIAFA